MKLLLVEAAKVRTQEHWKTREGFRDVMLEDNFGKTFLWSPPVFGEK